LLKLQRINQKRSANKEYLIKNKLNNARATMKALEQIAYAHGEAPVQATKVGTSEESLPTTN
jgi:hypothetical protein